jgi:CheY-like chemotaxis protein
MKKLLLTDSLKTIMETGSNALSWANIKISYASSAEEMLKIHRAENVDLIMTELDMPGLNGDEACSIIRKDDALKKVSFTIICDDSRSAIERCLECRANAYLTKPVDLYDIFRNVRKLMYVAERRDLRVLLHALVKGESAGNFFFANSHNISNSGILFDTNKVLKEGEKIKCSFYIDNNLISVEGVIVRLVREPSNLYYCGMQFTKLSPLAQTKIERFIQKN